MKKLMIALAVGAFVLSMAGVSSATDINIFGASAQFNFWSAQAPTYLTSASGAHCTGAVATSNFVPSDNTPNGVYYHGAKYFIASAGGCNATVVPDGVLTIRVGAYDSCDGLQGLLGVTNLTDVAGCTGNERAMLRTATSTAIAAADCFPVILGAADVDGTSITQTDSQTQLDGPKGPSAANTYGYTLPGSPPLGGTQLTYDLSSWNAPAENYATGWPSGGIDTTSAGSLVHDWHPFVLPFGFFANKDLAAVGDGLLKTNLTNITDSMAQQIFSGAATDWSNFGLPAGAITVCLRQPGSGTYGLFDRGVIKTNGSSNSKLPNVDISSGGFAWFNNTSGDMMNCINSTPGAIGFADADQGNSASTFGPINFEGISPVAASGATSNPNLAGGFYDRFFSLEHIFQLKGDYNSGSNTDKVIQNMVGWSYVQTNNPRQNVWVISNTMQWHKANDSAYPPVSGGYQESTDY